jgi:uncharacterized protein (TIGR00369 family)
MAEGNEGKAEVLVRWEREAADARRRMGHAGVVDLEQSRHLTGLQLFAAIAVGQAPFPHVCETADIWPVAFSQGRFTYQGRPSRAFLNPMGTIHGGWIATLLDTAVGCAVHTTLPLGASYTTAELKVSYVRAITLQVPLVRAEATVINAGRRLGFAEGRIVGPDGRVYAHATTTCLVMGAGA